MDIKKLSTFLIAFQPHQASLPVWTDRHYLLTQQLNLVTRQRHSMSSLLYSIHKKTDKVTIPKEQKSLSDYL